MIQPRHDSIIHFPHFKNMPEMNYAQLNKIVRLTHDLSLLDAQVVIQRLIARGDISITVSEK